MHFIPSSADADRLAAYAQLMKVCFPGADKFDLAYLQWLYAANPDGHVMGYDAFEGDELAAHYACIPAMALVEGAQVKVMLSLNTATHPKFQGKGLFTKLAERTYEAGHAAGFDAVYGVANANSTPGFVRKLGFQLVTPLEARIGVGGLLSRRDSQDMNSSFRRMRSAQAVQWRCSNPHNAVRVRTDHGVTQCFASARGNMIAAYHEFDADEFSGAQAEHVTRSGPPLVRLFLGLVPATRRISSTYVRIPDRLRPSPLNLIYRPLSGRVAAIEKDRVAFSFLDFDAY
ncbi:MAG: GNAT family N-acetyltransferase [Pseudomonadota bacterium]